MLCDERVQADKRVKPGGETAFEVKLPELTHRYLAKDFHVSGGSYYQASIGSSPTIMLCFHHAVFLY